MPILKTPDTKLLEQCRQYMLSGEPTPQGKVICQGIPLINGVIAGDISESGQILYIHMGQRPSVEELALSEAVIFESETPDNDLLELCRNVGLAAVGGITSPPQDSFVLDGLRGNLHRSGPLLESSMPNPWEAKIKSKLPIPILSSLNCLNDLTLASKRGAAGIGLIRSEHFCLHSDRLPLLQQLLLLEDGPLAEMRANELAESLSDDFKIILKNAPDGPIMFRLLDPPFHEFVNFQDTQNLPNNANFVSLYQEKISIAPTLVRRGMRLNIRQPAILRSMIKALDLSCRSFSDRDIYLTLPLTTSAKEINHVKNIIAPRPWKLSVMLETPSSLIEAPSSWFDLVDHFSIGGNDLTQFFLGISRDDRQDLFHMQHHAFIDHDPFATLGPSLKEFIKPFISQARKAGKKVNFCGQQAIDLESANFLINAGTSQLTCDINSLVPLRIQLSGVCIK